jgi:hypothetical protein
MAHCPARRWDPVVGRQWVLYVISEAAVEVSALVWLTFAASLTFFIAAVPRGLDREARRWARRVAKDRWMDRDLGPWKPHIAPYLGEHWWGEKS